MRNNCGSYKSPTGTFVRYGVGNPGGSDLIGLRTITITPQMVGQRIGQFVALEVKRPGQRPTEQQEQFMAMVHDRGGLAGVATSVEQAQAMLEYVANFETDGTPLVELGLTGFTYNALRRAGFHWIHELESVSMESLCSIAFIGPGRAAEIETAIKGWRARYCSDVEMLHH
jgi:hypothetical protein